MGVVRAGRRAAVTIFVAVTYLGVNDVSEYESQAIAVVTMQNEITSRWN